MRTVTFDINLYELGDAVIAAGGVHPYPSIERAIGYLSSWNMAGFKRCNIALRDDCDLIATYYKDDVADCGYVIAAIWQDNAYSFHS